MHSHTEIHTIHTHKNAHKQLHRNIPRITCVGVSEGDRERERETEGEGRVGER